jgi:ribose transport system substrate-binding protein
MVIEMATINDIAKMAGVSAATVSHVVNKTRYVSPELAKRVEDAINSLEFPPNFVIKKGKASAPVTTEQQYVVLIAGDTHTPFHLEAEEQIEKTINAAGYSLITVRPTNEKQKLDLYSQLLLSQPNALGVIAFVDKSDDPIIKLLKRTKIPIILVGKILDGVGADVILSDNLKGAYMAANHLIKSGHENIALLCEDPNSQANIERINGFKQALEDNSIRYNPEYIISGLANENFIFTKLKELLLGENPPTAIFAANYNILLAVFKFIKENNIRCPKDLSVVGFNDFEWASLHTPAITTVAQNSEKIAVEAAEALLARINTAENSDEPNLKLSPNGEHKKIVVPTELRVRESTIGIGRGPFGEKAASPELLHLTDAEKKLIRDGNYTAAVSFHYTGKAWMNLHEQGIKDVFNSLGISLIAITDAHFDPVLQSKQLESLLSLEPDILISIPTDNTKTSNAFKKVAKSKTKLVLITNVPNGLTPKDYVTCVSVNERNHGRLLGRGLGEYMTKHNKTKIGLMKYGAEFYATNQRDNAAEQILTEEYPELKVRGQVTFDSEEDAYKKTIELMNLYPEIEGIYTSWEGPAVKTMQALADIDRTDVAIVTSDLEFPIALNMAKGGMVKMIGAQCPYKQGQTLALVAANALIGKNVPSFIGLDPLFVTTENLLKSWVDVYREEPPIELKEALKDHLRYIGLT